MEIISKENIREITQEVIDRYVIPDFMERKHNASGEWIASLNVITEENTGIIRGLDYAKYLIDGRPPNLDQDPKKIHSWVGWAGSTFIGDWAQNKGININPYAIAYTIAREGTRIYKQGGSDFLEILKTKEVQDFILSRLQISLRVNVANTLRESLNNLKNA